MGAPVRLLQFHATPAVAVVIARQFWGSIQSIFAFIHLPRRCVRAPPTGPIVAWVPHPSVLQDAVPAARAFRAPKKNFRGLNRYASPGAGIGENTGWRRAQRNRGMTVGKVSDIRPLALVRTRGERDAIPSREDNRAEA